MRHQTMFRGKSMDFEARVNVEGVANPLSGAKAWFTLKRRVTDADTAALLQLVHPSEDGRIAGIQDGAEAVYSWRLEPTDTANLPDTDLGKPLPWDFQYASPTGDVEIIDSGQLVLKNPVTKASA